MTVQVDQQMYHWPLMSLILLIYLSSFIIISAIQQVISF